MLETVSRTMGHYFPGAANFCFQTDFENPSAPHLRKVPLAKLHGSIDSGSIIAPTWNKSVSDKMRSTWKKAHELLQEANHIRFVGYSLPVADAYIRYLLKSAVIDSKHLKQVDVVSLGLDGQTGKNYRSFIAFEYARYASVSFQAYCNRLYEKTYNPNGQSMAVYAPVTAPLIFDQLESAHESIMQQ